MPKKTNPLSSLQVSDVYSAFSAKEFKFRTTKSIETTDKIIAQKRAIAAINTGLGITSPGFNIYIAGQDGTGKTSIIREFLNERSKKKKNLRDWVYVFNFDAPKKPQLISLNAGEGRQLQKAMEKCIKSLFRQLPRFLQSEDFELETSSYLAQNNEKKTRIISELESQAHSLGFAIKFNRMGIETVPMEGDNDLTEKEYSKLKVNERVKLERKRSQLDPLVIKTARKIRNLELKAKEYITGAQNTIVKEVTRDTLASLCEGFKNNKEISSYLEKVKADIIENYFFYMEESEKELEGEPSLLDMDKHNFTKYEVNLFIDNTHLKTSPIIFEDNPTYYNLFGKIEKNIDHGLYLTDHTMIQAGSFHKANGGYLVVEANDLFKSGHLWDSFKRILKTKKGFIEDYGEQHSLLPTTGLCPQPMPLELKVILIGSDEIYRFLYSHDEEFSRIFRIKAEFDHKMLRNKKNVDLYISFIATRAQRENLLSFSADAVAAIVEYGSRLVEDQDYLSTQFSEIKDLTIEADFVARQKAQKIIRRIDVEEAIKNKVLRVNLVEDRIHEMIFSKNVLLSFKGKKVGQVNGLLVYDMDDHSFGIPGRISCVVSHNDEGVLNIDRNCKLSGKTHTKAVYIISSFLNAVLAEYDAIGLSVSVCFEQSYGQVDGDSASVAELLAIFSAMSKIPVLQNLAITGSLNQQGEVQSVGGINEKIEGFYEIYKAMEKQSVCHVIIPERNVKNLMLNKDCREAIKAKKLKIFPVSNFYQAFELACGVSFGIHSIGDKIKSKDSAIAKIVERIKEMEKTSNKVEPS